MRGRGWNRRAARLLGAAIAAMSVPAAGSAQDSLDPGELDPSAPMAPLPDLGVDWPDLSTPDKPVAPGQAEPASPEPVVAAEGEDRSGNDLRYTFVIEGLEGLGDETALLETFRKQSALEQGRKKTANAAQISRRSRSDAELLGEILRSHGYYDATVQPRIEGSSAQLEVLLEVDAGTQYRFAS